MARSRNDPIDIHVGKRLQARRAAVGLTQAGLAGAIGVTFQQVQKYERGVNRMAASTLYRAAETLGVDQNHFFEGLNGKTSEAADLRGVPGAQELGAAFRSLGAVERKSVVAVATVLAGGSMPVTKRGRASTKAGAEASSAA